MMMKEGRKNYGGRDIIMIAKDLMQINNYELEEYFLNRLVGLKYAIITKDSDKKIESLKRDSYSEAVIYHTIERNYDIIDRVLERKEFESYEHMTNYVMKILINNIDYVADLYDEIYKVECKVNGVQFNEIEEYHNNRVQAYREFDEYLKKKKTDELIDEIFRT